jgi:glycerate 2-kinase
MHPHAADYRHHVTSTVTAVLAACDPRTTLAAALAANPPRLARPAVIAIGKAAAGMFEAWCNFRGRPNHAIMVVPRGTHAPEWAIRADHPVPTQASTDAGSAIESFIKDQKTSGNTDGFIVLLSGGSSALVCAPVPPLSLDDIATLTKALLRSGAPIMEVNRVRKHLDRLKGGRAAALMAPWTVDSYIISDVLDGDVGAVGSGPTLPDGSTFQGALDVLSAHSINIPAVLQYLEGGASGLHPETHKFGDAVFRTVRSILVASNRTAVEAARSHLISLGFDEARIGLGPFYGDAWWHGGALAMAARALPALHPSFAVRGGETTVELSPASGVGGRNQELALAAALEIDGRNNIVIASFGTDGVDGPTDAAGAFVTGETSRQARSIGLNPAEALSHHDSHTFFSSLERAGYPHLIRTGPTGTNVNDIALALVY